MSARTISPVHFFLFCKNMEFLISFTFSFKYLIKVDASNFKDKIPEIVN